jgi:hypothetical protein
MSSSFIRKRCEVGRDTRDWLLTTRKNCKKRLNRREDLNQHLQYHISNRKFWISSKALSKISKNKIVHRLLFNKRNSRHHNHIRKHTSKPRNQLFKRRKKFHKQSMQNTRRFNELTSPSIFLGEVTVTYIQNLHMTSSLSEGNSCKRRINNARKGLKKSEKKRNNRKQEWNRNVSCVSSV